MFCITCCAGADEEGANQIGTIAVDEADPGLDWEAARFEDPKAPAASSRAEAGPSKQGNAEFCMRLERAVPRTSLGIVLDPSGLDSIFVCGLEPGSTPVSEANAKRDVQEQITGGDFIFSVNGVAGDLAYMMSEMTSAPAVDLVLRRGAEFSISVNRDGQSVGCAITYDATTGISLVVEAVNPGAISDFNDRNPENPVRVGDRIVAVNGKRGSAAYLLDVIRGSDALRLTFTRPMALVC